MLQPPRSRCSESVGGVQARLGEDHVGERSLLNQGLRSGSPTGSRVVATRSFGSRERPGCGDEHRAGAASPAKAAGQARGRCEADEGEAGEEREHEAWGWEEADNGVLLFCSRSWRAQGRGPLSPVPLAQHGKPLVNGAAACSPVLASGSRTIPCHGPSSSRSSSSSSACSSCRSGPMRSGGPCATTSRRTGAAADWSSAKLCRPRHRNAPGDRRGLCGPRRPLARHLRPPHLGRREGAGRRALQPLRQGRLGQPGPHQRLGAGWALVRQRAAPGRRRSRARRRSG